MALLQHLALAEGDVFEVGAGRTALIAPEGLQLQAILGVEVIDKSRYMEAAESYFEFITSKVKASNS